MKERKGFTTDTEISDKPSGPPITIAEIRTAIQNSKNYKAPGPDQIPSDLLLDERGITVINEIFYTVYDASRYPESWLLYTFIPLPKKRNIRKCEDDRLNRTKSHTLKMILKIIYQRMYKKFEREISNLQFGFRQNLSMREAIQVYG